MSSYPIIKIEGIGATYAGKLAAVGVTTTRGLLDRARDPKGRKALSAESGIDEDRILKWANMADLMRVKGIGEEYSELLEAAGVDTVKELKTRKAENLAAKIAEVNAARKLVRAVPSAKLVARWIDGAKTLAPLLKY
jgi:predicted flap endonuclease-1-like 5' DNA nuclease